MKKIFSLNRIPLLKKISKSIIRRWLFINNKEVIQLKLHNIHLELNIRDSIDREIYFNRYYEEEQIKFLINFVNQYNVTHFIDVGANIGVYSLRLSKQFQHLKVFAVEPHKYAFARLENNIRINNLEKNITAFNCALSNRDGHAKLSSNERFNTKQSGGAKISEDGDFSITQKLGDDLFNFSNQTVAIKIDVEGFEINVLKGLTNFFSNNNICLQIEIFEKNFLKVSEYLKHMNFKLIHSDNFTHESEVSDYFFLNFSV